MEIVIRKEMQRQYKYKRASQYNVCKARDYQAFQILPSKGSKGPTACSTF